MLIDAACRAGALKTDWTEPPEDAWPMGIEWVASPRRTGGKPAGGDGLAVGYA